MIVIPARIDSSRFPNKVLADIGGMPMVIRTAKAVMEIDKVIIAADSQEVIEAAKQYNIQAILTSKLHQSGTDRIYEAVQKLRLDKEEIIINVQADEPFIEKRVVKAIYNLTQHNRENNSIIMNSCYKSISKQEADDPNIVKVVTNRDERALYFSRTKIPYQRDNHSYTYKAHLGIYGFTVESLRQFCRLNPAPLENIEKLEQLRALYHGYQITMTEVETNSFGIDTPNDLKKALRYYKL